MTACCGDTLSKSVRAGCGQTHHKEDIVMSQTDKKNEKTRVPISVLVGSKHDHDFQWLLAGGA
jgi:hypothetical protein